jgi:hypothetical protein
VIFCIKDLPVYDVKSLLDLRGRYLKKEGCLDLETLYGWLFGPLATYRFFPHPKIVFATTWLDYLKSRCICSLLLEDIINLVVSRSDYIVVL